MSAPAAARIKVDFFEDGHEYRLEGRDAPSVTTILDAEGLASYEWSKPEHLARGKAVHKIAQIVSRGWRGSTVEEIVRNSRWDVDKTDRRIVGYGYAAAKYLLDTGFRPALVEQPVGSVRLGICGCLDAWGYLPSGVSHLPDYKSGQPLAAVWIQMALYAELLEETYGLKTDQIAPVWLQKTGEYKTWPAQPPGGMNLAVGISAINVYRWRLKHRMLG